MPKRTDLSRLDDPEISLLDILQFVKNSHKTLVRGALFGLVLAIAYIVFAPNQYEATSQIAMAQIGVANNNNNNLNPLGVNIEEPALLISRLTMPSSFPVSVIAACGFEDRRNPGESLIKSIKVTAPRGVANTVQIQSTGSSPEQAKACATELFELIKQTQAQQLTPYIQEAKIKLASDQANLQAAKEVLAKADKAGTAMGAAYLSTRDQVVFLLDDIATLQNIIALDENRATHLIAPIYVSNTPIAPKKALSLLLGLLGGLALGIGIALARQLGKDLQEQWQAAKIGQEPQA